MGYFTLARLGARLGFQSEPEPSHQCEHPAARIRNSKPALEIWAEPCSHWRLSSGSAQNFLSRALSRASVKCPDVIFATHMSAVYFQCRDQKCSAHCTASTIFSCMGILKLKCIFEVRQCWQCTLLGCLGRINYGLGYTVDCYTASALPIATLQMHCRSLQMHCSVVWREVLF